jgi:hypothetical protein
MAKAGMGVSVQVNLDDFSKGMSGFEKDIPYAISRALNFMAKQDAVPDLKGSLNQTFTIRNAWTAKGIRFTPSNKQRLEVHVGSRDEYMARQVEGGTKTPHSGTHVAIPLVGRRRARPQKKSITRPDHWPQALADGDGDVFVGTAGRRRGASTKKRKRKYSEGSRSNIDGRGTYAVWRRLPKHKLKMVYAFATEVPVEERWEMGQLVKESVAANWERHAAAAINSAIKMRMRFRGQIV